MKKIIIGIVFIPFGMLAFFIIAIRLLIIMPFQFTYVMQQEYFEKALMAFDKYIKR